MTRIGAVRGTQVHDLSSIPSATDGDMTAVVAAGPDALARIEALVDGPGTPLDIGFEAKADLYREMRALAI